VFQISDPSALVGNFRSQERALGAQSGYLRFYYFNVNNFLRRHKAALDVVPHLTCKEKV
jgi:hypothetical protein